MIIEPMQTTQEPVFIGLTRVGFSTKPVPSAKRFSGQSLQDTMIASSKVDAARYNAKGRTKGIASAGIDPLKLSQNNSRDPVERAVIQSLLAHFYSEIRP